jgi:predicted HTH transcriptional regulator
MASNLKELTQQSNEPIHFEFGNQESDGRAYVEVRVSPGIEADFKRHRKENMEFFRKLGEVIAEADREEQNEKYRHKEVQGSLFESIKERKG